MEHFKGRYDIQHNDIQRNDTQHNSTRYRVCCVSIMLNVVYAECQNMSVLLSVIELSVVLLNVVAPFKGEAI